MSLVIVAKVWYDRGEFCGGAPQWGKSGMYERKKSVALNLVAALCAIATSLLAVCVGLLFLPEMTRPWWFSIAGVFVVYGIGIIAGKSSDPRTEERKKMNFRALGAELRSEVRASNIFLAVVFVILFYYMMCVGRLYEAGFLVPFSLFGVFFYCGVYGVLFGAAFSVPAHPKFIFRKEEFPLLCETVRRAGNDSGRQSGITVCISDRTGVRRVPYGVLVRLNALHVALLTREELYAYLLFCFCCADNPGAVELDGGIRARERWDIEKGLIGGFLLGLIGSSHERDLSFLSDLYEKKAWNAGAARAVKKVRAVGAAQALADAAAKIALVSAYVLRPDVPAQGRSERQILCGLRRRMSYAAPRLRREADRLPPPDFGISSRAGKRVTGVFASVDTREETDKDYIAETERFLSFSESLFFFGDAAASGDRAFGFAAENIPPRREKWKKGMPLRVSGVSKELLRALADAVPETGGEYVESIFLSAFGDGGKAVFVRFFGYVPASEKAFVMYEHYERMGLYLGPFWLDVCGAAASAALAAAGIEPFWRGGRAAESLLKNPSDRAQGGQGERI